MSTAPSTTAPSTTAPATATPVNDDLKTSDFKNFGIGASITIVISIILFALNRKTIPVGDDQVTTHRTIPNGILMPILLSIGIVLSYFLGVPADKRTAIWHTIRFPIALSVTFIITWYTFKIVASIGLPPKAMGLITAFVFGLGLLLSCVFCMEKYKCIAYTLACPTPLFCFPWDRVYLGNFNNLLYSFIPCYDMVQLKANKLTALGGWNKNFGPLGFNI
jgi:hypothetical protein